MSLSGKAKLELCRRLVDDWEDLADFFEIEPHERPRFREQDDPARRLLEWLEVRQRLDELPTALENIHRPDLARLVRGETSTVAGGGGGVSGGGGWIDPLNP